MIFLALFVPIILYILLVKWLFKKYYKDENKIKRRIFFILLVTLPFWDHIAGYAYFKYLCLTKGGITIYKIVTDLQEQKDYWFYEGLSNTEYHNKDKEYKYFKSNELILRNGKCLKPIKKDNYYTCAKKDIERVYLNYCNNKYNNLPTNHKDYKSSCINTDKVIKKYDLKNVIKVPRSPYIRYVSVFDKSYSQKVSNMFRVSLNIIKVHNKYTNEILSIEKYYSYDGGWYVNSKYINSVTPPPSTALS